MKILLVDDDVFLRDMYATKFSEKGDTVVGVQDGEEALHAIATDSFDVVIMDMVMPGMTGIDLLNAIKKIGVASSVKCIVLSNQGEDSDMDKAYQSGAVGYIIKADSIPSEVVEKVHQLVL
jgi:two-component system, OmpR family, response regulator